MNQKNLSKVLQNYTQEKHYIFSICAKQMITLYKKCLQIKMNILLLLSIGLIEAKL